MSFRLTSNRISIILCLLALCGWLHVYAQDTGQKTQMIVSGLLDSLKIDTPVILDIRCGEWTPALERDIRLNLLSKGIDVRESNINLLTDNSENLSRDTAEQDSGSKLLEVLKLPKAELLELTMEQTIETGEKRNFISYARFNAPVYRFELRQVSLPDQRLLALKEYKVTGKQEIENPGSLLAMKWYEPIIASAILGSLVMMLWTLK